MCEPLIHWTKASRSENGRQYVIKPIYIVVKALQKYITVWKVSLHIYNHWKTLPNIVGKICLFFSLYEGKIKCKIIKKEKHHLGTILHKKPN